MGTTLTALNTGYADVTFAAMIEGFPYVLTSGDPDATFAAFDGSTVSGLNDIDDAIGGLTVDWGGMSQMVDPWKPLGDAPTLRLVVAPGRGSQLYGDVTDIVGETIHKRQGGHETLMAAGASVDCNDLTLNGRHSSGFAASGVVYVGPEAMVYTSVTGGGAFTISKRGYCSPFQTASGARFARTHKATDPTATTGDPVGVTVPPLISDEPRNWIGKWVGVWILRNSGGTLDLLHHAGCLLHPLREGAGVPEGREHTAEDEAGVLSLRSDLNDLGDEPSDAKRSDSPHHRAFDRGEGLHDALPRRLHGAQGGRVGVLDGEGGDDLANVCHAQPPSPCRFGLPPPSGGRFGLLLHDRRERLRVVQCVSGGERQGFWQGGGGVPGDERQEFPTVSRAPPKRLRAQEELEDRQPLTTSWLL